jgi:hypothetical protein
MKNFLEHLAENQKTYEFKVKIADIDPAEHMEHLETALGAYALESISKPKRLPIQESCIDFPNFKNCQVYLLEVILKYPVNADQLRQMISERAFIAKANIVVTPSNHPEELWRNNEGELREYKQGESVLDKPYEDNPAAKKAGDAYASFNSILKELSEATIELASDDTPAAKTTNDLPQGTLSPVGSNKNKIPSPVKGK